jgi:hypothetical protein
MKWGAISTTTSLVILRTAMPPPERRAGLQHDDRGMLGHSDVSAILNGAGH